MVAFHQQRAEFFDFQHPHGLGDAELVEPVHRPHILDPAPEQGAGAVADCGQVDGAGGDEEGFVILFRHAALADHHLGAGGLEPVLHPFRETEAGGCRDGADVQAAVFLLGGSGGAVEIDVAELREGGGRGGAVCQNLFVDALAGGVDQPVEINHVAEGEFGQGLVGDGCLQADCLALWGFSHEIVSRRI